MSSSTVTSISILSAVERATTSLGSNPSAMMLLLTSIDGAVNFYQIGVYLCSAPCVTGGGVE